MIDSFKIFRYMGRKPSFVFLPQSLTNVGAGLVQGTMGTPNRRI